MKTITKIEMIDIANHIISLIKNCKKIDKFELRVDEEPYFSHNFYVEDYNNDSWFNECEEISDEMRQDIFDQLEREFSKYDDECEILVTFCFDGIDEKLVYQAPNFAEFSKYDKDDDDDDDESAGEILSQDEMMQEYFYDEFYKDKKSVVDGFCNDFYFVAKLER